MWLETGTGDPGTVLILEADVLARAPFTPAFRCPRTVRTKTSYPLARDLLARTADALPSVIGPYPMLSGDLHTTLYRVAAQSLCPGDTERAHRLADQAESVLAAYLEATHEVDPDAKVSRVLRGWLVGQATGTVVRALRAASGWRPAA